MSVRNDAEFRAALRGLSVAQQRLVAARFLENVAGLSSDARVMAAIQAAKRPDITEPELEVVHAAAKTASVESYTHCGDPGDWMGQAGHFVAEAAATSVMPSGKTGELAWDAAMRGRMARTCQTIAEGRGTDNQESVQQYAILAEFLNR